MTVATRQRRTRWLCIVGGAACVSLVLSATPAWPRTPPRLLASDDGAPVGGLVGVAVKHARGVSRATFARDRRARTMRRVSTPPPTPRGVTAKAGVGRVVLSWTRGRGGGRTARYRVSRRAAKGRSWSRVAELAATTTSYEDTNLRAGVELLYVVRAINRVGAVSRRSRYASATPVPGTVVWKADGSRDVSDEWASMSTQTECATVTRPGQQSERIARIDDLDSPSPASRYYRISVRQGDDCSGRRSELAQGNPVKLFAETPRRRLFQDGEDRWISWAVRLGSSWPIGSQLWQLIAQWKQTVDSGGSGGNPAFQMTAYDGVYRLIGAGWDETDQGNTAKGAFDVTLGRAVPGRWVRFTLHVKFASTASAGLIELFGDLGDGRRWRTLVRARSAATLKRDTLAPFGPSSVGATIPSHARIGIYRDNAVPGDTHLDVAGYTVATARAAAESAAFKP